MLTEADGQCIRKGREIAASLKIFLYKPGTLPDSTRTVWVALEGGPPSRPIRFQEVTFRPGPQDRALFGRYRPDEILGWADAEEIDASLSRLFA